MRNMIPFEYVERVEWMYDGNGWNILDYRVEIGNGLAKRVGFFCEKDGEARLVEVMFEKDMPSERWRHFMIENARRTAVSLKIHHKILSRVDFDVVLVGKDGEIEDVKERLSSF